MNLSKQIYNCNVENDLHTCECELPNPLDVRRSKDYVGLQEIFRVRESRGRGRDASVDFRAILFIYFIYLFVMKHNFITRSDAYQSCGINFRMKTCNFILSIVSICVILYLIR